MDAFAGGPRRGGISLASRIIHERLPKVKPAALVTQKKGRSRLMRVPRKRITCLGLDGPVIIRGAVAGGGQWQQLTVLGLSIGPHQGQLTPHGGRNRPLWAATRVARNGILISTQAAAMSLASRLPRLQRGRGTGGGGGDSPATSSPGQRHSSIDGYPRPYSPGGRVEATLCTQRPDPRLLDTRTLFHQAEG